MSDGGIPLIDESIEPAEAARIALERGLGEFFAAASFEPARIAAFIRAGFLPMAASIGGDDWLLPKLHLERAVLEPGAAKVNSATLRAAARYGLAVDRDFRGTMEACARRHGEDWLTPRLRAALAELHRAPPDPALRLVSFELYSASGAMAAGEIGYALGGAYTSLSGFYAESGAGNVQLAATAGLLRAAGASHWDLGMPMPYKESLGARSVGRGEFLDLVARTREAPLLELPGPDELLPARAAVLAPPPGAC